VIVKIGSRKVDDSGRGRRCRAAADQGKDAPIEVVRVVETVADGETDPRYHVDVRQHRLGEMLVLVVVGWWLLERRAPRCHSGWNDGCARQARDDLSG